MNKKGGKKFLYIVLAHFAPEWVPRVAGKLFFPFQHDHWIPCSRKHIIKHRYHISRKKTYLVIYLRQRLLKISIIFGAILAPQVPRVAGKLFFPSQQDHWIPCPRKHTIKHRYHISRKKTYLVIATL